MKRLDALYWQLDLAPYCTLTLADDEQIAFNAGSHAELIRIGYKDYERLVQPVVAALVAAPGVGTAADGNAGFRAAAASKRR